jgi:GNAT superfamily N-acetyltransferase
VRALHDDERPWAAQMLREAWSSERVVYSDGREYDASTLPGLVADAANERAGLATYAIEADACELVTLNALTIGAGVGGALIEAVVHAARAAGCARVSVMTTNDNLPALRVYQRHGFALTALLPGAVELSRRRKPEISLTGHAGIPIRDELVLERAV